MGLALVISIGLLVFSGIQYFQTPKTPETAKTAPSKSVNIDDFLKSLDKPKEPPPKAESPMEQPKSPKPEPIEEKYKEEVSRVYGCYLEARKKSGLENISDINTRIERLRKNIQSVADDTNRDRGQPFVSDFARIGCDIMGHPKFIDYLSSNTQLFVSALNFHLKAWDQLKDEATAFEKREQERVERETSQEIARVQAAKQQALFLSMVAGGAFSVFMLLALFSILASIETNIRGINESVMNIEKKYHSH